MRKLSLFVENFTITVDNFTATIVVGIFIATVGKFSNHRRQVYSSGGQLLNNMRQV
jgi:hypothetical protein